MRSNILFFLKISFTRTVVVFLVSLLVHLSLSMSSVAEEELTAFVRTLLMETSANKRADIERLEIKSCSASCVSFKSSQGSEFKLVVDTDRSEPELSFTRDSRTLTLPSLFYVESLIGSSRESGNPLSIVAEQERSSRTFPVQLYDQYTFTESSLSRESGNPPSLQTGQESSKLESSPEELLSLIHRWLVGHELHPYSGGFSLLKPSQTIALEASLEALKEHQKEPSSLLNIAPTASGKTQVLVQTLMEQIETYSNGKKLFIVTADRVHLVEQLYSQLQGDKGQRDRTKARAKAINVINWSTLGDKSWQSFASEVKRATESKGATVMVITSQSLKLKIPEFFTQTERRYREIQESFIRDVGGIYIDEAHHLGANETRKIVMDLVARSKAFLYGATATPVHHEVELRDFFKREHWTYLNTRDNLFERHGTDSILDQLAIGIERGELTPFNDLYVIGEQTFKDLQKNNNRNGNNTEKEKLPSVFIQAESAYYVLNPAHYENLLRMIIGPILSANKKGFIVTATIAEAERLTEFLNRSVTGIEFEVLHSQMEEEERRGVLRRSVNSQGSHYIVSVRVLDEGINLPHLSAYIDLNFNVSIKQMIHRIGRVLRLYPNKLTSDVLFLIDYRDESKARDALSILDKMKNISFRGGEKRGGRGESGDSHLLYAGTGISPMSRQELEEMRDRLHNSIRRFWQERYTLEEIPGAVARINKSLPENEQIRSDGTYNEYLRRKDGDKRLPLLGTVGYWYAKKHGDQRGLMDFILGREPKPKVEHYSLKEIPGAVARINKSLSEDEQIRSKGTYKEYLERKDGDKRLPLLTTVGYWYAREYGDQRGLVDFILGREPKPKVEHYSLKEIPAAVARINKSLPEDEQIRSDGTYKEYLRRKDRDKRLPPIGTVGYWYAKKHGDLRGLLDFILGREPKPKVEHYSLKEIPGAVARINKSLSEDEQIRSKGTYKEYLSRKDRDKRLPLYATVGSWYAREYGHQRGLVDFILGRESIKYYSLEEIPVAVARINKSLPENEQIRSDGTYNEYLRRKDRDKRLSPLGTVGSWYEKEHGHRRGLMDFILGRESIKYYSLEEIPGAVSRINKSLPEDEQIRSKGTYNEYLRRKDGDKRLPLLTTVGYWYAKKHGDQRGLMDFILGRESIKYYSLEEIPAVVARINERLPEDEQIKSKGTYNEYLRRKDRDKRLPPIGTVGYWYAREYGDQRGLLDFILSESNLQKSGTCPTSFSSSP